MQPNNYDSDQIFYCVRPQINVHKPGRSYSAHHMRQHLLDFAMTMDEETRKTVDTILNTRGMSYSYYRDRMACKGTCGFETTLYLLSQMFHVDICVIRSDFVWVSSDVHPSHCPVILIQLNNGRFCGTKPSRPFDVGTVPLIHVPKLGVKKFVQTSTPGRWQESSELKSALQRTEMSPIFASPSTSVEPASTESSSTQSTQENTTSISDILSGNSLSTEYKSMANIFLKGDTVNVSQNVTDDSCKVTSENSDLESTITNIDRGENGLEQSSNREEKTERYDEDGMKNIKHGQDESAISRDATFIVDDVNNKFVSHDHSYSKTRSQDDEEKDREMKNIQQSVGDDDTTITGSQESSEYDSEEERKDAELGEKYLFDQLSDRLETTLTVENSSDEAERVNPVRNVNKFSLVSDGNVTKVIVWPHNTVVATRLQEGKQERTDKNSKLGDVTTDQGKTMDNEKDIHSTHQVENDRSEAADNAEFCDLPATKEFTPNNELQAQHDIHAEIGEQKKSSDLCDVEATMESEEKADKRSICTFAEDHKRNSEEKGPLKNVTKDVSIRVEDISFELPITGQNDSFTVHGDKENTSVVMFACRKCPEILYSLTAYNQHLFKKHRITYVSRYPAKMIEKTVSPKKAVFEGNKEMPITAKNSDAKCTEDNEKNLEPTTEEISTNIDQSEHNEEEASENSEITETLDEVEKNVQEDMTKTVEASATICSVAAEGAEFVDHATTTFNDGKSATDSPTPRKPKSLWISQHSEENIPTQEASPIKQKSPRNVSKKTKTLGYVRRSSRPRKSTQTSTEKQRQEIHQIIEGNDIQDITNEENETETYMNVKLPKDELKRYRRKYACNYCDVKTFTEQGYLLHIRNEHKINYQCCNCLKPFHFEDSFQRHRKICIEGKTHLEEIFDVDEEIVAKNVSKNSDVLQIEGKVKIQLDLKATSTDEETLESTESKKRRTASNKGKTKATKSSLATSEETSDMAISKSSSKKRKDDDPDDRNKDDYVSSRGRNRKRDEPSPKKRRRDDNSKQDSRYRKPLTDSEKLGNDSFKKLLQEFDLTMRPMKKSKKLQEKERKLKELDKGNESPGMKLRSKNEDKEEDTAKVSNPSEHNEHCQKNKKNAEGKKAKHHTSHKYTVEEKLQVQTKKGRRSTRSMSKNSDKSTDIDLQEAQDTSQISDIKRETTKTGGRRTRSTSKNSDRTQDMPSQQSEEESRNSDHTPEETNKRGRKTRASLKKSEEMEDTEMKHIEEPSPISDMINESKKRGKKRKRDDSVNSDKSRGNKSEKTFSTKKPTSKKNKKPKKKDTIKDTDETLSAEEDVSDQQASEKSSDEDDGQFYCQVCDKTFTDYGEFKNHKVKCTKIPKKYICPECKYTFAQKCLRDQHYRWTHTDLPPEFVCKICDKAYPYKKSLEEHNIRKHSEEFKFLCDICTRGFNHLGEFNQHRASHTGVKEFKCGKCNIKSFSSVGKLNYHLKHCGKPNQYECSVCGKKFSSPRGIAEHVTNEHNDKTERKIYQCPICPGATYTSHGGYCRHLREKHQVGRKGQTLDAAVVDSFFKSMQDKPKK